MSQFLKKPRYLASNLNAQALLESISKVVVTSTYPTNKSPDTLVIGTHDGSFHCDEALAISLLQLHPTYAHKVHIVRTRKPDILDQCDVVVDVGATYDPSKHRYDHHQREFVNTFTGYHTKLSSAGIIYQQFGKEILSNLLIDLIPNLQTTNQSLISIFYQKIYAGFIEHIDAIDNGVAVSDGEIKYHVSTTLSSRVGHLNPEWNEPQTPEIMNERFIEAMMLTCSEFIERVSNLATIWWPARSIVQEAIENRFNIDTSGKIIVFKQFCPWKDHLFELEQEMQIDPIVYALYQDSSGSYRIQAVPVTPNSFDSRKKLPLEWCGLRDQTLSDKAGIPGCIFIHATGFIGGANSYESALAIAKKALEI